MALKTKKRGMTLEETILQKTIEWAKRHETIRVLFLTSTRAGKGPIDELSDYDIAVFSYDSQPFLYSSSWMKEIGEVWVYQKCEYPFKNHTLATRLVVFKDGERIDFSFWHMAILCDFLKNGLPDDFNIGYKVLLDKDGLTRNLPEPTFEGFKEAKPTKDFFLKRIHDFWFDVYCMAKYLKRQDLFHVKIINSEIDQYILQMIIWNMQSKNNWSLETHSWGKKMKSWVDNDIWQGLHDLYSHFDAQDSWRGLFAMVNFFRKISKETCLELGYSYPADVDQNLSVFIENVYEKCRSTS
jgi:aminoglycoside 6-adenylyltransferase